MAGLRPATCQAKAATVHQHMAKVTAAASIYHSGLWLIRTLNSLSQLSSAQKVAGTASTALTAISLIYSLASKFTRLKRPAPSTLRMATSREHCSALQQRWQLDIADSGPGISAAVSQQIFIPFFTTKQTGSGIGLSLSRALLQVQDAQLNYVPGELPGSCFRISFAQ